jgi:hypothetical protein
MGLKSGAPAVWLSRCNTDVFSVRDAGNVLRQRVAEFSLPASTSWSTAMAVKDFVTEAGGKS